MKKTFFAGIKRATVLLAVLGLFLFSVSHAHASPVVFVDNSWDSIQVHNRVAGFILEKGYGRDVSYIFAETMPGLLGLERGDIDVLMEGWVDNYQDWWDKANDEKAIFNAGKIFPDAPQGWYVPDYIVNGDESRGIEPVAPDLNSVSDLKKYWEIFEDRSSPGKGRLYNGPSGWVVNSINIDKIKAYGLEEYIDPFDPGSQTALAAAIAGAYEKGDPVLAYYWEPTAIMGEYNMIKLEEPPYDEKIWKESHGCAHPPADVVILLNIDFANENPDIRDFLVRYSSSLAQTNSVLAYMKSQETDAQDAAMWFLKEYPDEWRTWVDDENRISKIEEALDSQ